MESDSADQNQAVQHGGGGVMLWASFPLSFSVSAPSQRDKSGLPGICRLFQDDNHLLIKLFHES